MTMVSNEDALLGLWFDDQLYFGATMETQVEEGCTQVLSETRRWLDLYFQAEEPGFLPKMSLRGTPFRIQVWEMLLQIPYGQVRTYKEIAREIAQAGGLESMSAQAVGGAVGHNPISLLVPCHRVIGVDGSLTGYAGGVERKRWLLEMEQQGVR